MRVPRRPGTDTVDEEKLGKTIGKKIDTENYFFFTFSSSKLSALGSPRMLVSGRYFIEKSNYKISTQIFERSHYSFV